MEGRKFSWFPKLTDQVREMPEEVAGKFLVAVLEYGTYGIEPEFDDWTLRALFAGMKDDIDNSISSRENGGRGGRLKKTKKTTPVDEAEKGGSESEPTPVDETCKGGSESEEGGLAETARGVGEDANPYHTNPYHSIPDQEVEPPYPLACLDALNEELRGLCGEFTRNPNGGFLAGFEGRVPVEDVRRMVRFKRREWEGTRFQANLNPKTLFSPDHFEAYMAQSRMPPPSKGVRVDDELRSYDQEL